MTCRRSLRIDPMLAQLYGSVSKALIKRQCFNDLDFEENGVKATIRIIDAPQVGYSVRKSIGYAALCSYANEQLLKHLYHELEAHRATLPYLDERIHVCLYFLTSQSLSQQDIVTLEQICQFTNVILVAGKADMMTEEEQRQQEEEVLKQCRENGIALFNLEEPKVFPVHRRRDLVGKEGSLEEVFIKTYLPVLIERSQSVHYENYRCHRQDQHLSRKNSRGPIDLALKSLSIHN